MRRNFTVNMGIYLVQPPHELDLHNDYDFQELRYSVAQRTLLLLWRRSEREGVRNSLPASSTIEFSGVTEFRFLPRRSGLPFTEDDCLRNFGYWTDEDWRGFPNDLRREDDCSTACFECHRVHVRRHCRSSGRLRTCNNLGLTNREPV